MDSTGAGHRGAAVIVCSAVLAAVGLAGCTADLADATRAGGDPPPVTLTMGTNDPPGRVASDQIERFAQEVADRSGGRIVVEPRYEVGGEDATGWDQEVARHVMDGRLDLAVVPARAWDLLEVDTLRPLSAPFVLTDDAVAEVVADDDLAADLMSGLQDVGVTGLALLPEGMRHLFLVDDQEATLGDLQGGAVRAPASATTWALLQELGLRPSDADPDDGFAAYETAFALAGTLPPASAAVHLALYPKVNVVVAGTDRLAGLTDEQRQVLQDAALAVRDHSTAAVVPDTAQAAAYCEAGGVVLAPGPDDLAAAERAADAVLAELRADDATAELLERVTAVADQHAEPVVAPCGQQPEAGAGAEPSAEPGAEPSAEPSAVTSAGGDLPDGTYRVEFSDEYLASFGLGREMVANNHGVWTITLAGGRWSVHQVAPGLEDRWDGVYEVDGDRLSWVFYEGEEGGTAQLTWSVDEAGDLRFEWLDGGDDARFHFALPWRRVG
jgi:TRAP-type C4-dicarboxylate transport system substrate-binding protein